MFQIKHFTSFSLILIYYPVTKLKSVLLSFLILLPLIKCLFLFSICFVEYINYFCNWHCFVQFAIIHLIFQHVNDNALFVLRLQNFRNTFVPTILFQFYVLTFDSCLQSARSQTKNISVTKPFNY